MIVDGESYELVNAIESLLEDARARSPEAAAGDVKPELMESVLEIATRPAANTAEAGVQLRALRQQGRDTAAMRGLTIGSAGPQPLALGGGPRGPAAPRYPPP